VGSWGDPAFAGYARIPGAALTTTDCLGVGSWGDPAFPGTHESLSSAREGDE